MARKRRRITLRGKGALRELEVRLARLPGSMDAAVINGLRSATMRGVPAVVQSIDTTSPHAPVNNGTLRQSVGFNFTPRGGKLHVDAPHAAPMERGTRPFWPPLDPLIQWVMDKGFADVEIDAIRMAMHIQRKIARDGLKPRLTAPRRGKKIKKMDLPRVRFSRKAKRPLIMPLRPMSLSDG